VTIKIFWKNCEVLFGMCGFQLNSAKREMPAECIEFPIGKEGSLRPTLSLRSHGFIIKAITEGLFFRVSVVFYTDINHRLIP